MVTFLWCLYFLLNELNLWYDLNRGNWWGHSPYKHGTPCSACPPSYGGGCKDNLCYKGMEKMGGSGGGQENTGTIFLPFLWFYSKMTAPTHHKRKQKKTTSLSRRPLAVRRSPGPGPVPPPKPLSSPPQRRSSCRRMKWSTLNRCVSCHFCCLFWISFHLKLDGGGSVLGWGGARAAREI